MRLYRLTLATILHRKAWILVFFVLLLFPFVFPYMSSATEKPLLVQPARILAAWNTLWVSTLLWGFVTAAHQGSDNARSGIGEYFRTTGVSASRQLFQIWLAMITFIVPAALLTAGICQFAACPGDPVERAGWWVLNVQYLSLFLLVVGPLLALAVSVASRYGSVAGFSFALGVALYGLWGMGYVHDLLKSQENPVLQAIWLVSPQYRWADLTARLHFKFGPLPWVVFGQLCAYFVGIAAVWFGISRVCFRCRAS